MARMIAVLLQNEGMKRLLQVNCSSLSFGNVSSTNVLTHKYERIQNKHPAKFGNKNGSALKFKNESNISTNLDCGYCRIGSAKYPLMAGLIKNPYPHIPMTIAIVLVSFDLSPRDISMMIVLMEPTIPLLNPRANRAASAIGNVGARPNITEKNAESRSDALMVNVRLYRSAALPQ